MAKSSLVFLAGETQKMKFTVTDKDSGAAVDVSSTTAALDIRNSSGSLLTKDDDDFDKGEGASGILKVTCALTTEGKYNGILSITFAGSIVKKHRFGVEIRGVD